jgi:hypothetical protein
VIGSRRFTSGTRRRPSMAHSRSVLGPYNLQEKHRFDYVYISESEKQNLPFGDCGKDLIVDGSADFCFVPVAFNVKYLLKRLDGLSFLLR